MPHKPVPETLVGTLTQEWAGIIWCTYVETVQGKAIPQVLVEYLVQSVWYFYQYFMGNAACGRDGL